MTTEQQDTQIEKIKTSGVSKPRRARARKPEFWYLIGSRRDPQVVQGDTPDPIAGPFPTEAKALRAAEDIKREVRTDFLLVVGMGGFVLLTLILLVMKA